MVVAAVCDRRFVAESAGLKALIDAQRATINSQPTTIGTLQSQFSGLQTLANQKPSMADVNQAIAANSACNVDGEDEPLGDISDPPTQAEVQDLQACLKALIDRLQHGRSLRTKTIADGIDGSTQLFLRINQNPVMHEHDQVVLPVAGHVGHEGFAGFRHRVHAAEGVRLEDLPAFAGHELVV